MKKRIRLLAIGFFVSSMIAAPAIASETGAQVYEPLPQSGAVNPAPSSEEAGTIEVQSNVPQAQVDYRNKRLESRMQRDEMLKMRAAVIEAQKAELEAEK